MNDDEFNAMRNSLLSAQKRFPNCRIANCDCDEFNWEWKKDCHCMGHFEHMNKLFGKDNWNLHDAIVQGEKGIGKAK